MTMLGKVSRKLLNENVKLLTVIAVRVGGRRRIANRATQAGAYARIGDSKEGSSHPFRPLVAYVLPRRLVKLGLATPLS